MARVSELEEELAHLRAAYEQYFLGVERRPPTDAHEKFKRGLRDLKGIFVRHTGANFKVQGLSAKYLTYERLWTRTLQEMEAGTYKRDVYKAKKHLEQKAAKAKKKATNGAEAPNPDATPPEADPLGAHPEDAPALRPPPPPPDEAFTQPVPAMTAAAAFHSGVPLKGAGPAKGAAPGQGQAPAKGGTPAPGTVVPTALKPAGASPAAPAGAKPPGGSPAGPAARPPGPPGKPTITAARGESVSAPMVRGAAPTTGADSELSERKIKAIYDAYVMAKKRCNEDVSKLSVDNLATTLRKQVPELMKQHGAKSVEFKVVIKDGKAILRALPKI